MTAIALVSPLPHTVQAVETELPTPVALADALANPTVPQVGSHGIVWNGSTWERQRTPNVFKTVTATASGDTALWTPAASRRFRLMAYRIEITGQSTLATAGTLSVVLRDATTALAFARSVYVPSVAVNAFGADGGDWVTLGNGYASPTLNNVLNVNLSASLLTGAVRVVCAGTEET